MSSLLYRIAFFIPIVPIIIALTLMVNTNRVWESTYETYIPLTHHLTSLRNNLFEGHLWLEESISGDTNIDLDKQVYNHFEHPRFEELIYHDRSQYSEVASSIWKALEKIDKEADELLMMVHVRLDNATLYAVGSQKDELFDAQFIKLIDHIDVTQATIQTHIDNKVTTQKELFFNSTILFALVSFYIFYRFYRVSLNVHSQKRKFEYDAHHDKLTGIANRHRLNIELDTIDKMSTDKDYTFILMDLDHFKHINDTFGHAKGDEVLKEVASIMTQSIRESDLVGRWGGEEFIIICSGISVTHATQLAERIRQKIELYPFDLDRVVTASFGIACLEEEQVCDAAIHDADVALYEAKANGRNQVVCFDPSHE
jgi:diguanylate cyclase (GGDEF)-like protein